MTSIKIPSTIEGVRDRAATLDSLATATEWERAAIVAAFVPGSYTAEEFADLDFPGMNGAIRLAFHPADFATLAVFVLVIGLLATLYPVRRAVRLDPVAALRRT